MDTSAQLAPEQSGRRFHALGGAAFFALFYVYVWVRVNPALIYHGVWRTADFPIFFRGGAYFREVAGQAGGLVRYTSALLSQLYYWPWLGSLAIASVVCALCLATGCYFRSLGAGRAGVLGYAPAILLLLIYGRYGNPMALALALLAATVAACVYAKGGGRSGTLRAIEFVVLGAAVYCVAGAAVLAYAFLCAMTEFAERRRGVALVWLALSLIGAAFVVGRMLWLGSLKHIPASDWQASAVLAQLRQMVVRVPKHFPFLTPGMEREHFDVISRLENVFVLFYPLAAALLAARGAGTSAAANLTDESESELPEGDKPGTWRQPARAALCAVVAIAAVLWLHNSDVAPLLRIELYAANGAWEEVLAQAKHLPPHRYDLYVNWHVNRALQHLGLLGEEMFAFPQDRENLVPATRGTVHMEAGYVRYKSYSDILMDLGFMNEAEHMAHEALELLGDRPQIVKTLALINMAKGKVSTARAFLTILSRDVVNGRWARERLRDDAGWASDPEVRRLRSVNMVDDALVGWSFETNLLRLLERNRRNRMAFDYLMAYYLLMRELSGVVDNLARLDDFDCQAIPRHYEEALLVHMAEKGQDIDLHGRAISAESRENYRLFQEIIARHGHNRTAAKQEALARCGDTYFFYHRFGSKGKAK